LNFAPTVLTVPDGVDVRKVDLSIELQILAFHEQRKAGEDGAAADLGEAAESDRGRSRADRARADGGRPAASAAATRRRTQADRPRARAGVPPAVMPA